MSSEEAKRLAEENVRLEQERLKREDEKRRKQLEKEDVKRVQWELEKLGVFKEEAQLAALDPAARQELIDVALQELVRAKEEETPEGDGARPASGPRDARAPHRGRRGGSSPPGRAH
ncbi:unnamed protein product [Sphagnum jensenii]|uniref:Uncharacterized protein n=2 Tax=Sphagnum jensenii TaxID=128206 RepID=A0ABP0VHV0_9BRYO